MHENNIKVITTFNEKHSIRHETREYTKEELVSGILAETIIKINFDNLNEDCINTIWENTEYILNTEHNQFWVNKVYNYYDLLNVKK